VPGASTKPDANVDAEPPVTAGLPSGQIDQNIGDIVAFQEREHEKVGTSQRRLEVVSTLIGRPLYLVSLLSMVGLWIAANGIAAHLGAAPVDPPPFVWLTGFLTLAALITATVVLFAQNRQSKLENQRAHLDLQVNLLTEQKVTKLIHLIEELRRDLPMVKDRHDPEAVALQQRTDTSRVLSALESGGVGNDGRQTGRTQPRPQGGPNQGDET
jgi:uncharacterized membrane protein